MTERKRLKAIRRRNRKVKNHNFATKTLKKVEPIFRGDSKKVMEAKEEAMEINKQRRIQRNG